MSKLNRRVAPLVLVLALAAGCAARKPGAPIQPGFNMYSKQQDIELGREAAQQVRQEVMVVDDQQLQDYISRLGQTLAKQPRAEDYPYSFTLINDPAINAFALPGGPIFINTGTVAAADNEAQLAGVMAHEIGHVALRHGTNQASKASILQIPAVLAGATVGSGSALGQLAQLGIGIGLNGVLMKYSRDAETQADALGSRILASAGYNPIEMARFFEKLQAEGGSRTIQFFSSHPDPGNRVKTVEAEIQAMPQQSFNNHGTGSFDQMKARVAKLPKPNRTIGDAQSAGPPKAPTGDYRNLETDRFVMAYPGDWQTFGDRNSSAVTLAPREGLVQTQSGGVAIGYGAVVGYYNPQRSRDLEGATRELISQLQQSNPGTRVGQQTRGSIDGNNALLSELTASSPFGGAEVNQLLTVARPEGLFYLVFVAPQSQYSQLSAPLSRMRESLRFGR